jgi:hypothetical protein
LEEKKGRRDNFKRWSGRREEVVEVYFPIDDRLTAL